MRKHLGSRDKRFRCHDETYAAIVLDFTSIHQFTTLVHECQATMP